MIAMRKLDPFTDEPLIREALGWIKDFPRWFKDADEVWGGTEDIEGCLTNMAREPQVDFGVFVDGCLVAIIDITLAFKDVYNLHLMTKRGARPESVIAAAAAIRDGLVEKGMKEAWCWPAKRNYGLRKVLVAIGMVRDGVSMIRGTSHGREIEWQRYSYRGVA